MRLIEKAAENLRLFAVLMALVAVGFAAFGIGLGLTLSTSGALAGHDDTSLIHACYDPYSGDVHVIPSGNASSCHPDEVTIEWESTAGFDDLAARVSTLEAETSGLAAQVPSCLSEANGNAVFSGCNVVVNNGEGSTATKNGTGNLIVGYNELPNFRFENRSGSHNLVVGPRHNYSSWGGFVAGYQNEVSGEYSTVSGGEENTAIGDWSSISGGNFSRAIGDWSSVSGGSNNTAEGIASSVSAGASNIASGDESSISGGSLNRASHRISTIGGGLGERTSSPAQFLP